MIYSGWMQVIDFMNYYFIYRMIFHAKFIKSMTWKLFTVCVGVAITGLILYMNGLQNGSQIVTLVCMLSIVAIMREHRLYGAVLFPLAFLVSGSVNVLVTYFFSWLFQIPYSDFLNQSFLKIISEIPSLILLVFLWLLRGRKKTDASMIKMGILKYCLVLLGSVSLFLLVGISQGFMLGKPEAFSMMRAFAICSVIAVFVFLILILWQVVIEKRARQYQEENMLYRSYMEKQEIHVRDVIEADQKMRRFRHDIRAHITAIEAEIENGDMEALKRYVHRMREESEKGFRAQTYTGIVAVDAVIDEWHQKATEMEVKWTWEGSGLPLNVADMFELCVIFSNLLGNAVEAVVKAEGEKKIEIYCGAYQENIVIRVSNTCSQDFDLEMTRKTSKSDAKNHGLGLRNIQTMVERRNGSFQIKMEDGVFKAEVTI